MADRRNRTRLILWTLLALLLAGALVAAFWPRATLVDLGEVTQGPLTVTIDEEGKTQVHDVYVVSTPVAGRLLRVQVIAGDEMEQGAPVAHMRPTNPDALDIRTREQAMAATDAAAAALKMQADVVNDMAAGTGIFNLRIGFHLGDVLFDATDIFGDAVNVAARITDAARAGQILTSGETVARLGGLHLGRARAFDHVRLKGKTDPVHLYEVVWEQEEEVTRMANGPGLRPEGMTLPDHHHLNLVLGDRHLRFAPARLPVSLGRDGACDLPVDHPLASRRHAQCEYLRGKFVFSDHSTNGSFVTGEDGREVFLRRESMPLVGRGVISLGCPLREQSGPVLRFQVE